ncbi:arginine--tRNA ligase [Candidatus Microgenomates bacterium]|nr:arginine--tRNA ligase [Candidatus Microgenomates bacterium]
MSPHVAKAVWGTEKLLKEKNINWGDAQKYTLSEKAHLLGQGYIEGNKSYEENKEEIDGLNKKLYVKDPSVKDVYERTRKWSLDYYSSFYSRFYTHFDKLYFESEMADPGKKIVLENVGKVFEESDGAIVFAGEKYGLHTRVFVTKDGNPTYEGKDMALAPAQFNDFPFDKCVHVVANEQTGYFQVIIKALELINPNLEGREYHLPMGMVQLVGQKISSRTGVLVTVDGLLDDVKALLKELTKDENSLEPTTIAAVKYSVLKTSPIMNSTFDLEKSVSLDGDSGPYIQYSYARARSVLRRANFQFEISNFNSNFKIQTSNLQTEEIAVLRFVYRFPEVVEAAARTYSPNLVCTYLFELAKRFNNFYNSCPILDNEFRLALTQATSIVLKNGLNLLGIESLERM